MIIFISVCVGHVSFFSFLRKRLLICSYMKNKECSKTNKWSIYLFFIFQELFVYALISHAIYIHIKQIFWSIHTYWSFDLIKVEILKLSLNRANIKLGYREQTSRCYCLPYDKFYRNIFYHMAIRCSFPEILIEASKKRLDYIWKLFERVV